MNKVFPDNKPAELDYLPMHGPVEVQIRLHVMVPARIAGAEIGSMQKQVATLTMEIGRLPTQKEMQDTINALIAPGSDAPAGTRLMTKPEFIAHTTKRETGLSIPMLGLQEFEPYEAKSDDAG